MSAPRFFVPAPIAPLNPGDALALPDAVAHHAGRVLRLAAGDVVVLFDGTGGEYRATLASLDRRGGSVRIDAFDATERESPLEVTLAQALIAADAMDSAVRKAVELGAKHIVPVAAERSQRPAAGERADRRRAHWQAIAIAACEQCGRNRVPPVAAPVAFAACIDEAAKLGPVAIAGPGAPRSLAELAGQAPPRHLFIGPEGGFSEAELALARRHGATVVHLGPRVLRAETAAVAALATLAAIAGDAR